MKANKNWIMVSLVIFLFIGTSAFAQESRPASYTSPIKCVGSTTAEPSGDEAKLTFDLNATYERDDEEILDIHQVTVETSYFGFASTSKTFNHPHYTRDCTLQNNKISCSGVGIGTGEQEFKILIDLQTKSATGYYKSTKYPNPAYNATYKFTDENPLACEMF